MKALLVGGSFDGEIRDMLPCLTGLAVQSGPERTNGFMTITPFRFETYVPTDQKSEHGLPIFDYTRSDDGCGSRLMGQ